DQVGVALLEDLEAHRAAAVEAARVVDAGRLQPDLGDIAQAQAAGVDDQLAQLGERADLALRLHPQAHAAVLEHAGRDREVDRAQALGQRVQRDPVRIEAVRIDRDLDLVGRRAVDLDPGYPGHALDPAL